MANDGTDTQSDHEHRAPNGIWVVRNGGGLGFGKTKAEAWEHVLHGNQSHITGYEMDALIDWAQSLDRVFPSYEGAGPKEGDEGPAPAKHQYAAVSPQGISGGTWTIIRNSVQYPTLFDIVMPDVGSQQTAMQLLEVLNNNNDRPITLPKL